MELFLLASVALLVFGVVAATIILWVSFRRTIELRRAVIAASARIERLERTLASVARGAAIEWDAWEQAPALEPKPREHLIAPPRPEPEPAPELEPEPPLIAALPEGQPSAAGFSVTPVLVALACVLIAAFGFTATAIEELSASAATVIALIASAVALAIGEWLRRARPEAPRGFIGALNIVGLAVAMASAWLAGELLRAIPAGDAFFICALSALCAMALSELYGAAILAFGLAAALALPALIGLGPTGILLRHAFLVALTAIAIVLARRRDARIWAWLAGAGALAWGLVSIIQAQSPLQIGAAAAYLAILASIGLAYAWEDARAPLRLFAPAPNEASEPRPTLIAGGALCLLCAALLVALFARSGDAAPWAALFLIALIAAAVLAAAFAEALAGAALIIAAASVGVIAVWPSAALDAPSVLIAAAALALIATLGGGLMMAQARFAAPGALLAALGPAAAVVCAEARLGPMDGREIWAGAALIAAGLNALFCVRLAGQARAGGAAASFAAGAFFALAAALSLIAPDPWRAPAIALAAPAIALLDRRLHQRSLRLAGAGVAALAVWRLIAPILSGVHGLADGIIPAPQLSALALGGVSVALAFFAASHFFRGEGAQLNSRMTTALFAGAALLLSAGVSLAVRHFFTQGAILSASISLPEAGAHTLNLIASAAILASRFGPRPLFFWTQTMLFAAAAAGALFFGLYWLNPWWGAAAPAFVAPMTLALAYAAPAIAIGAYAWLSERQGLQARANFAATIALVLFAVWATLEIRRFFHPADLAHPAIAPPEGWALTLTWLALALTLAFIADAAGRKILAAAARALAAAALIKSAVFDLGDLNGFLRAAAMLSIGLACLGILLLRNRFWASFLGGAHVPDPNLTPPR